MMRQERGGRISGVITWRRRDGRESSTPMCQRTGVDLDRNPESSSVGTGRKVEDVVQV